MISRCKYPSYASHHDPAHTNICEHTALHVTFYRIIIYEIESNVILKSKITENQNFQIFRILKISNSKIDRNFQDPENFDLENQSKFSGS